MMEFVIGTVVFLAILALFAVVGINFQNSMPLQQRVLYGLAFTACLGVATVSALYMYRRTTDQKS